MRALIDTDVLLDVALAREPHAEQSAGVLRWAEAGGSAVVAWHTLTNCAYLLKGSGRPFLERLTYDLDDAFQAAAALAWQADVIVTRNLADYRRSPVRALSPAAFLRQMGG